MVNILGIDAFIPLAKSDDFILLCETIGIVPANSTIEVVYTHMGYVGEEITYHVAIYTGLNETQVEAFETALANGDMDDGTNIARWWRLDRFRKIVSSSESTYPSGYWNFESSFTTVGVTDYPVPPEEEEP